MKKCTKCKLQKNLEFFDKDKSRPNGYSYTCKQCKSEYTKTEKHKSNQKKCYIKNKENVLKKAKIYYQNNCEKIKDKNNEYYNLNKEIIKERRKKYNYKITTNLLLRNILRSRIGKVITGEAKGNSSAVRDLGCSIDDFKKYLESKFQPGMSWENRGKYGWHIDHIIPLGTFNLTVREEFLKACHYTNLQPLWARDNLRKAKK